MTMIVHTDRASGLHAMTGIARPEHGLGQDMDEGLAAYVLAAEECDCLWEARRCERWLGVWEGDAAEGFELDRVAILGWIAGRWFAANVIIDGNGCAHTLLGRHDFESVTAAREAFENAR